MRVLILLVALLMPGFAYAAGPCGDYEYAELQDMDKHEFMVEHCKVVRGKHRELKKSINRRGPDALRDADSCLDLQLKMERIFKKKFKVDDKEIADMRDGCLKEE